ncbi:MAG TPA: ribonuclease H-like domain-containing protein [Candidatus Acidoferrum sp.]|nr:ribonuclease H-like domain-containing protein [Candidatus Acidoferrum sp.]
MSDAVQNRFSRLAALKPARRRIAIETKNEPRGLSPEIPEGSARLAALLGAAPAQNRYGEHLALRRWFSESIGCEPPDRVDETALRLLAPDATADVADPQQWLFLDTETTGLAGGTGTYPFLVGIGWWDAGGLEVEQFFMRDHSEEHSLLVALAERMSERRVLVTFNGKTFDWPLLETRYRMTRVIRPPAPRAHLDFLHPARTLWRLQLGSARLPALERHALGWDRGVDIDSSLIPTIYFDFLRGGSPDPLVPIFLHNQMDLRGLAGLAALTLSLLENPETHGRDGFELLGVSRICERRGHSARARKLYECSIASELPLQAAQLARKSLARLAKKDRDFAAACVLWTEILTDSRTQGPISRDALDAYEQLAIHLERGTGEPHRAAVLVRQALAQLRCAIRLGSLAASVCIRYQKRFEKRLSRLERVERLKRKTDRTLLDASAGTCGTESCGAAAESN